MNNRVIKRLRPKNLDAYTEIYLNAYPFGKDFSKECYDKYYNRNLQSMNEYEHVNFYGMFEDDVLVSIMKLIDFDINLFGEMNKATGLMSLAVHPIYKKKGIAKEMVKFFEKYTLESGAILSMLLPFDIAYYRKMGYGFGTRMDEYKMPITQLPNATDVSKIRFIREDEFVKILKCHSDFVKNYHGAVKKFEEEIRDMSNDVDSRRLGYFDKEELKGYISFNFVSESEVNYTLNKIVVNELIYTEPEVLRALLAAVKLQSDLAQNIVIRSGESDFMYLLNNPQDDSKNFIDYGFLQTNISAMGNMYKILDAKTFVEGTAYRKFINSNLRILFKVVDDIGLGEENFVIGFEKGDGNYSCWKYFDDTSYYDVKIECKRSDFSALLMGSADLAPFVRLGIAKISDINKLNELDRLFHCNQKPFNNTDY